MGFKSKKSASRSGNRGGRPPSGYSNVNDAEKVEYHKLAVEKYRHPGGKPEKKDKLCNTSDRGECSGRAVGHPP